MSNFSSDIPAGQCLQCRKKETTILKLSDERRLTRTKTMICQNKKCQMFIDLAELKNWIQLKTKNYQRDFYIQNKEDYQPNQARRSLY